MISPIQNFDQNNIQEKLLAKAPSSPLLDSQMDPPQIDQKPCIETFPINLNSNNERTENSNSRKPFLRPPTPFPKTHNWHTSDKFNSSNIVSNKSADLFIDKLIEGKETKLIQNHNPISPVSIFLHEFKPHLQTIDLIETHISGLKETVHLKSSFIDTIRMGRLINLLNGEAN